MGVGWRRTVERVREATGVAGKGGFTLTSNKHCEFMLKEATDFAKHLKDCRAAIDRLKTASEDCLATARGAMGAPLPRCFEETAAVAGGGAAPVAHVGGPDWHPDAFAKAKAAVGGGLEAQVLVPMAKWLDVHASLAARYKEAEALRLELDSRRHTAAQLAAQADSLRGKLSKAATGAGGAAAAAKLEGKIEETAAKLVHKEGKAEATRQAYEHAEQALRADLAVLVRDAQWLRHYVAQALRLAGEGLAGAARDGFGGDTAGGIPGAAPSPPDSPRGGGRGGGSRGEPLAPAPGGSGVVNPFMVDGGAGGMRNLALS